MSAARRFHAFCPVQHFDASKWPGWTIVGKELVGHTAGVRARVGDGRADRFMNHTALSSGKGYEGYHLTRPA